MASTSSAVGLVQGHVSRPTHVAWCGRGHSCPYYARKCCWFLHDEDGEGSACAATARAAFPLPPASLLVKLSSLLEQIADVLKVIQQRIVEPIVDGPVQLAEFVGVWEQIVDVPVLRTMEDDVGVVRFTPQERVQNRTHEQISPMPQLVEECVHNRTPEQIVDFPVPQIMEAAVDFLLPSPQERVQNCLSEQIVGFHVPQIVEECVQNRAQEQNADSTVPQFMEAAVENCVGEQISNSFVPQFMGADVEIMHATPQVRMQTRTLEQTLAFPVPQFSEECVPDRYAGADYGLPCVSEHGSFRGTCA